MMQGSPSNLRGSCVLGLPKLDEPASPSRVAILFRDATRNISHRTVARIIIEDYLHLSSGRICSRHSERMREGRRLTPRRALCLPPFQTAICTHHGVERRLPRSPGEKPPWISPLEFG